MNAPNRLGGMGPISRPASCPQESHPGCVPVQARCPNHLEASVVLPRFPWPIGHLVLWCNRIAAWHELSQLVEHQTDTMLRDVGLTRLATQGRGGQAVLGPFWAGSRCTRGLATRSLARPGLSWSLDASRDTPFGSELTVTDRLPEEEARAGRRAIRRGCSDEAVYLNEFR
jgi:hypothetical protein